MTNTLQRLIYFPIFQKAYSSSQYALGKLFAFRIRYRGQIYLHIFPPNEGYCFYICTRFAQYLDAIRCSWVIRAVWDIYPLTLIFSHLSVAVFDMNRNFRFFYGKILKLQEFALLETENKNKLLTQPRDRILDQKVWKHKSSDPPFSFYSTF